MPKVPKGFTKVANYKEWENVVLKGALGKQSGNLSITYQLHNNEIWYYYDSKCIDGIPQRYECRASFIKTGRELYIKQIHVDVASIFKL